MVNPKLIRAAVQAEREAKDQAALLGFEKATSHHLDVTHPAAVELMSIFDSQDSAFVYSHIFLGTPKSGRCASSPFLK